MADFKDDLDILNYALTLEHLESNMYQEIVASGKLTGDEQQYATQFGGHEAAHVTALTQTIQKLNGTPVAAQAKYNFPAFDTRDNIVKFLVTIEDLGAGAYLARGGGNPEPRCADGGGADPQHRGRARQHLAAPEQGDAGGRAGSPRRRRRPMSLRRRARSSVARWWFDRTR